MPEPIRISAGSLTFEAELNDTITARRIYEALPIEGSASRWGDEIYFRIPMEGDESDPMRTEMELGELAYWPPGQCFCIFWGPTPASVGDEPRAASDVVPVGRVMTCISRLTEVGEGDPVVIERR